VASFDLFSIFYKKFIFNLMQYYMENVFTEKLFCLFKK